MASSRREVEEAIAAHPCFDQLPDVQQSALIDLGREKRLSARKILFQCGDAYRGFYIVISGTLHTYRLSPEGRMLVTRVLRQDDSFAISPLFEENGSSTYTATAESLRESRLLFLPQRSFRKFASSNPQVYPKLLQMLGSRVREAVRQIDTLSLQSVQQRLAGYLVGQVPAGEKSPVEAPTVELDVPKTVLAAELGTVPETLSRTLRRLEQRDLIRSEASEIVLTGLSGLRRLSQDN